MRGRLVGFVSSALLFSAVAGLAAPPAFATDYFVKYIYPVLHDHDCHSEPPVGPRHGTVVFKRTQQAMSATVYLRNASHNSVYAAAIQGRANGGACLALDLKQFSTDGHGNGTVQLPPKGRTGMKAFWVEVVGPGEQDFETAEVPAFGF